MATDAAEINAYCIANEMPVVMTGEQLKTGTDRIAAAMENIDIPANATVYIVNIQGDEPLVTGEDVDAVVEKLLAGAAVVTGVKNDLSPDDKLQTNLTKVGLSTSDRVLWMSRQPMGHPGVMRGTGLHGFRSEALAKFAEAKQTPAELGSDIELLRCLEHDMTVRAVELPGPMVAVDVAADIAKVEKILEDRAKDAG